MGEKTPQQETPQQEAPQQEAPQQPSYGKFNSAEDLLKSYTELEKTHYTKLNELHQTKEQLHSIQNPKKSVSELLADFRQANTPIDYEVMRKNGYEKEIVDIVQNAEQANNQVREAQLKAEQLEADRIFGESKNEIVEFSNNLFNGETFNDTEREVIKGLESTNPLLLAKITSLLHEGYDSMSNQQNLFNPYTQRLQNSSDVFKSEAEYRNEMRSDKFRADKNYRDSVIAKANRSFL